LIYPSEQMKLFSVGTLVAQW